MWTTRVTKRMMPVRCGCDYRIEGLRAAGVRGDTPGAEAPLFFLPRVALFVPLISRWGLSAGLIALAASPLTLPAQSDVSKLELIVRETIGLRRFGYPVLADVTLSRGEFRSAEEIGLQEAGRDTPGVQVEGQSFWPDGSVRGARISLNLSPGPFQSQRFRVVRRSAPAPTPRPAAESTDREFVVRNTYRIGNRGSDLITSIRYGDREFLREPVRLRLSRPGALTHENLNLGISSARLVSAGPVHVEIEMVGSWQDGETRSPFRITLRQPNSKSWFDLEFQTRQQRSGPLVVELSAPYRVEGATALYDYGVGSWVYGMLRGTERSVLAVQRDGRWTLQAPPAAANRGGQQDYAAAGPRQARAEGWAHLVEGARGGRAIAFGSPQLAGGRGGMDGSIGVDARGECRLNWLPRSRTVRVQALYHHVNDPVHVSAATSPAAMLNPLEVTVERSPIGEER